MASKNLLVFFVTTTIIAAAADKVHHALLRYVRRGGQASLNLASLAIRSGHALSVLRVAFVNGSGVDILVIVRLEAEEPLILGELIPSSPAAGGLLQTTVNAVTGVGDPWLKGSFVAWSIVGYGGIGSESGSGASNTVSILPRG